MTQATILKSHVGNSIRWFWDGPITRSLCTWEIKARKNNLHTQKKKKKIYISF